MRLQISTRILGDVTVVDCNGEIVYGEEAPLLRQKVKELLQEGRHVVLNLSEVRAIDSNGVGALVSLMTSARAPGGDLKLAALGQRMKDVLKVTKLTALFAICDTVEEAVERFRLETTPIAVSELGR
ncbi:MAG: STAS domain-containing protein [Acidobacteriia bacterium]|nr:STAS domain-containing protein [Terriglobia bacterium]